jgi:hypothetical protein
MAINNAINIKILLWPTKKERNRREIGKKTKGQIKDERKQEIK